MRKKRLAIFSAAVVLFATVTVCYFEQRASSLPAKPVTLRYAGTDAPGEPLLIGGLILWVTNHTQKTVYVGVTGIEVRAGTVWTNYPEVEVMPLLMFPEDRITFTTLLGPHAARRGILRKFPFPEKTPWRIKVSVSENLAGARYFFAGSKEFVSVLFRDHRMIHPFGKEVGYLGPSCEVVSEEITYHLTEDIDSAK